MSDEKFQGFLIDSIFLLKESARKAKLNKDNSDPKDFDYNLGYLMAFHEVISLLEHQAFAFNIKKKELGLADIDADKDLL